MKPIVIYLQSDKIQLTKEELEKYLQQAYDAGYEDGKIVGTVTCEPIVHSYGWTNLPYVTTATCSDPSKAKASCSIKATNSGDTVTCNTAVMGGEG